MYIAWKKLLETLEFILNKSVRQMREGSPVAGFENGKKELAGLSMLFIDNPKAHKEVHKKLEELKTKYQRILEKAK